MLSIDKKNYDKSMFYWLPTLSKCGISDICLSTSSSILPPFTFANQALVGGVSSVEAWPASLFLLLLTISCSGFPQQTKPVGNWSQHTFLVVLFNSLTSFIWKTLSKISLTLISTSPYQIYTMVDKCQVWLGNSPIMPKEWAGVKAVSLD